MIRVVAVCLAAAAWLGCTVISMPPAEPGVGPGGGTPLWELPPSSYPSQRLYRGSYDGPEGGGAFRATLRLAAPDRYRLDAADRFGRLLWSVGLEGGHAWWIDHQRRTWCPRLSRLAIPGLGVGPLPPSALPAILLGRLPVELRAAEGSREQRRQDAAGNFWAVTILDHRLAGWTVSDDRGPLWWWRYQGKDAVLSQRQGRQIRWRQAVVEPLGELPPFEFPVDHVETCDALR